MKYKYEFESKDFQKGDCSECPISYKLYDPEHEEWVDVCPVGSPTQCPLEDEIGGESKND